MHSSAPADRNSINSADSGARPRHLLTSSSVPLTGSSSSIVQGVTPHVTPRRTGSHFRFRCYRRSCRQCMVAVILAVVLLVAQASVTGGLAAESDRKSRRKQSPSVVDSSYVTPTEYDRARDKVDSSQVSSNGNVYAAGNTSSADGRRSYVGESQSMAETWRNSSSATMATTSPTTTEKWNHGERFVNPKPADLTIECKQLRSKRYISDGFCTSIKPVVDVVCTGSCLPIRELPWYAEFIKVWSHAKTLQYRCVDDDVRRRDVLFACDNGETRTYRIRVVRSCKCKRYVHSQNESPSSSKKKKKNRRSRRSTSRRRNAARDLFSDDDDDSSESLAAIHSRWDNVHHRNDDDLQGDGDF